jgi:DNA-binding beta-propeller fold protein YncE
VATFRGDDGPALAAQFSGIEGIGQDRDGKIFVADFRNRRVRIIDRESAVATVAGSGSSEGSPVGAGVLATAGCPAGLAVGRDGRIYFADLEADRIRVLTAVDF